ATQLGEGSASRGYPATGTGLLTPAARACKWRSAYGVAHAQQPPASLRRGPGKTCERGTPPQARAARPTQGDGQLRPSMRRHLLIACAAALAVAFTISLQQPTRAADGPPP